jgi:putative transposase
MRHHGIRAITARQFRIRTTVSHHDLTIAPNRLDQNLAAERPNQVWLVDITYVVTSEGRLYILLSSLIFSQER